MVNVEKHPLAEARASAVTQTVLPAITASDQVSVALEPDEGEYQGVAAAAQPDRAGHGGCAQFGKRGQTCCLLVMAETVVAQTDAEKGS